MQSKRATSIVPYVFPRLQDILFISILIGVILYGPELFNKDGDLGRHITIGRYILESRSIPTRDIFSHTKFGQSLVPHEWLAQTILGTAYNFMGLNGDVFLAAIIIAVTFVLIYKAVIRRGTFRLGALFVTLWAAEASVLHWLARPHLFTFLFLVLWTDELERVALGNARKIWYFPVLMLVWANTHGAFIAGFVVWGVYLAEWLWHFLHGIAAEGLGRKLVWIGISSFLCTLINPSGWHLWETSIGYVGNHYLVSHTLEYLPPDFQNAATWPFMFMLAYGLFALVTGRKLRLREGLLLAGWSVMALFSARNIPLFAIITAPIYGQLIQSQAETLPVLARLDAGLGAIESQLRGFFWPVFAVAFVGLALWQNIPLDRKQMGNRFDPQYFPIQAVDWLREHPQDGNMFNDFTWGGYLLYRMWPEERVFIDGQTDFYGEALTREYEQAITVGDDWENVLRKYNVQWVIIPVTSHLANALIQQGWHALYEDSTAAILRK